MFDRAEVDMQRAIDEVYEGEYPIDMFDRLAYAGAKGLETIDAIIMRRKR